MKKLLSVMLVMVVCVVQADIYMSQEESRRMVQAEGFVWRETELSDSEKQSLLGLIRHQNPDVAAEAFVIAVVRNADNVKMLHEVSSDALSLQKNGPTVEMARRFLECDVAVTSDTMARWLKGKNLAEHISKTADEYRRTIHNGKTADDYFYEILKCLLIREARTAGRPVVIPPDVQFGSGQLELFEDAYKPEKEAWDYLFAKIKELDKRTLPVPIPENKKQFYEQSGAIYTIGSRAVFALTTYPKVFFTEVAATMRSENISDTTREFLQLYMWDIWMRLDNDEQMKTFAELQIQLDRPQAKVTEILWRDEDPSEEDLRELLRLIDGPSERLSAYAMSAVMARCPKGRRLRKMADDVLKLDLNGKRNTKVIAEYLRINRGVVTVEKLHEMLKKEKNVQRLNGTNLPDDYFRDVLVVLLLREARKSGQPPSIFTDVLWNQEQQWRLLYGYKPTTEAWNFLYPKLSVDPKKRYYENPLIFFLYVASSYPNVFFDEAMTATRSKDAHDDGVRNLMILYLVCNDHRLDEQQLSRYFELLQERKIPWHYLWDKPSF